MMDELIETHLKHARAAGLSPNTIEDRRWVLRKADGDLPLGLVEATVEELEEWMGNPTWSAWTRVTYYGHLVGFFHWACNPKNPKLDYDPSAGLVRPKSPRGVPRPVSEGELAIALERSGPRWRLFILLAAYAGLRCMDIVNLERRDITETNITIRNSKGRKDRIVPTHPLIWQAVRTLPDGRITEVAAGGREGLITTPHSLTRMAGIHLTSIGLGGVTMHRFRHRFATILLAEGANLRVVQELMGHSSPATTAVYTLITDEQRRIAIAALPAVAPAPC